MAKDQNFAWNISSSEKFIYTLHVFSNSAVLWIYVCGSANLVHVYISIPSSIQIPNWMPEVTSKKSDFLFGL